MASIGRCEATCLLFFFWGGARGRNRPQVCHLQPSPPRMRDNGRECHPSLASSPITYGGGSILPGAASKQFVSILSQSRTQEARCKQLPAVFTMGLSVVCKAGSQRCTRQQECVVQEAVVSLPCHHYAQSGHVSFLYSSCQLFYVHTCCICVPSFILRYLQAGNGCTVILSN